MRGGGLIPEQKAQYRLTYDQAFVGGVKKIKRENETKA